jgi:hypothetical protein
MNQSLLLIGLQQYQINKKYSADCFLMPIPGGGWELFSLPL